MSKTSTTQEDKTVCETTLAHKTYANEQLRHAVHYLKQATTMRSLKYRIWVVETCELRALRKIGYYWQTQRIRNYIHYMLKKLSENHEKTKDRHK